MLSPPPSTPRDRRFTTLAAQRQIARCFNYFFMVVVVIRSKTKVSARRALTFIVRIFVNDTIATAIWTSFHVSSAFSRDDPPLSERPWPHLNANQAPHHSAGQPALHSGGRKPHSNLPVLLLFPAE